MKQEALPTGHQSWIRVVAALFAAALFTITLAGVSAATADATVAFDGASFKKKPATLTGFHEQGGKGEITRARLLVGGPDAKPGSYGRISWKKWNRKKAVGFGTGWHRGKLTYRSKDGANPWNGGRVKVVLRFASRGHKKPKPHFTRMSVTQKPAWRTGSETGACNYGISFAYKPAPNRAHPWMQFGIGGGWPLKRDPCFKNVLPAPEKPEGKPAPAATVYDGKEFSIKPATLTGWQVKDSAIEPRLHTALITGLRGSVEKPGKIKWTSWGAKKAIGTGAAWSLSCSAPCANSYPWDGSRVRVTAFRPVDGSFTRLKVFHWTGWGEPQVNAENYTLTLKLAGSSSASPRWKVIEISDGLNSPLG